MLSTFQILPISRVGKLFTDSLHGHLSSDTTLCNLISTYVGSGAPLIVDCYIAILKMYAYIKLLPSY